MNRDDKRTLKDLESMVYPLKRHAKYLRQLKKELKTGRKTPLRKKDRIQRKKK